MEKNEEIAKRYLEWVSEHYDELKGKFAKFSVDKLDIAFDEDVFSDTYLKIYDKIIKDGLEDASEKGFGNYIFIAYKNNARNKYNYAQERKRDKNIKQEDINQMYEEWFNEHYTDQRNKLIHDLFIDFSTLYLLLKVEKNFDNEHYYVFKLKHLLPSMTYQRLAKTTNIKASRIKVLEVSHWLKENLTKDEIKKAFYAIYSDLIDF